MIVLPSHGHVYLRPFAEAAPEQSPEIAEAWKILDNLECTVTLASTRRVDVCAAALRATCPAGWEKDVWHRRSTGQILLHPSLCWAWLMTEDLPAT